MLTLTLTLTVALGLVLGLTPGKTISVKNLNPNAKDEYCHRCPGKNVWNFCKWKVFISWKWPKLTLTLTLTLTLGLGLGLTPRKTIGVENLKRNAKDACCEKRLEKNFENHLG